MDELLIRIEDVLNGKYRFVEGQLVRRSYVDMEIENMSDLKYKVGDKVRIKDIGWYNENKNILGNVECGDALMTFEKARFCGKIVTISSISDVTDTYGIEEDNGLWRWTDEMIECKVEESKPNIIEEAKTYWDSIKDAWVCPEGYHFKDENGNIINAKKIVLEKKSMIREKQIDNAAQEYIDSDNAVLTYSDGFCEQTDHPFIRAAFKAGVEWADNNVTQDDCSKAPKLTSQDYSNGRFGYQLPAGFEAKLTERELILTPEKPKYPKTYEECCKVLNTYCGSVCGYNWKLLLSFQQLLICRDAYWKIAGEEMGLGKPWKPDYDSGVDKFGIICLNGVVQESNPTTNWERHLNKILDFPTQEMRDAFYENFKDSIELCKELL